MALPASSRSRRRLLSVSDAQESLHRWPWRLCCVASLLACSPSSSAASSLSFVPCASATSFECGSLPVPLDRAGAVPGTISLSVERRLAGAGPSRDAVVALAGGPGQAARSACRVHRPGDRAGARLARPARVRPARHRRLRPTELRRVRSVQRKPANELFEECATRSDPRAAPSRRRNPCRHRGAATRPAAMKSSSCTAPRTAPRSRWSTPSAPTGRRGAGARLGRAAGRPGTVRDPHLPSDRQPC